jgi:hypothetical protein
MARSVGPFSTKNPGDVITAADANTQASDLDELDADLLAAEANVTAMPETIRDMLATALVAGSNVTITPNDGSDTITIAAAAASGTLDVHDGQRFKPPSIRLHPKRARPGSRSTSHPATTGLASRSRSPVRSR